MIEMNRRLADTHDVRPRIPAPAVPPVLIVPSILPADFTRPGEEVRAIDAAGADWIHVDGMDGRFVPDIIVRPVILEAIRRSTCI